MERLRTQLRLLKKALYIEDDDINFLNEYVGTVTWKFTL